MKRVYKAIKKHFITLRWLYTVKNAPKDKNHPDANFEQLESFTGMKFLPFVKLHPECFIYSLHRDKRDPIIVEINEDKGQRMFYFANFLCYDAVFFPNKPE